jgi:hypothetical protein
MPLTMTLMVGLKMENLAKPNKMAALPMGTIMAVAAVLEIHIDRNIVQIMNPDRWRFTA